MKSAKEMIQDNLHDVCEELVKSKPELAELLIYELFEMYESGDCWHLADFVGREVTLKAEQMVNNLERISNENKRL